MRLGFREAFCLTGGNEAQRREVWCLLSQRGGCQPSDSSSDLRVGLAWEDRAPVSWEELVHLPSFILGVPHPPRQGRVAWPLALDRREEWVGGGWPK